MNCFEPGEVLVLPKEGGTERFGGSAERMESRGEELSIISSTEDILGHYLDDMSPPESFKGILARPNWREQFEAFPFVIRVPEGQERERAALLRSDPDVSVAIPNYFVNPAASPLLVAPQITNPSSVPVFDQSVLKQIEAMLNIEAQAPMCGSGVKIAVLDTGVASAALDHPGSLYPVQFVTDTSIVMTNNPPPYDPEGHGSTVAHIINQAAPAATIFSVKCLEKGNIGAVISAFYLAEAAFQPDIYNLSLALGCEIDFCSSCGNALGNEAAVTEAQLQLLFETADRQRRRSGTPPLLIAAAGNYSRTLKMPARFPNVLAVGSYDIVANALAPYARYRSIPAERFILAPGGLAGTGQSIGHTSSGPARRSKPLYGTSFAAAFVSAVAARYLCATKPNAPCAAFPGIAAPTPIRDYLLECLANTASFPMADYSPRQHGLGMVRYEIGTRMPYAPQPGVATAKFIVEGFMVKPGQTLYLSGNVNALGGWQLKSALPMMQVHPGVWQVSVGGLQPGIQIEYKYIRIDIGGYANWEEGPNRAFDIPNDNHWCCVVSTSR